MQEESSAYSLAKRLDSCQKSWEWLTPRNFKYCHCRVKTIIIWKRSNHLFFSFLPFGMQGLPVRVRPPSIKNSKLYPACNACVTYVCKTERYTISFRALQLSRRRLMKNPPRPRSNHLLAYKKNHTYWAYTCS